LGLTIQNIKVLHLFAILFAAAFKESVSIGYNIYIYLDKVYSYTIIHNATQYTTYLYEVAVWRVY